jgi:hypothetical protein
MVMLDSPQNLHLGAYPCTARFSSRWAAAVDGRESMVSFAGMEGFLEV